MNDLSDNFNNKYGKMAEKVVSEMAIAGWCIFTTIVLFLLVWAIYYHSVRLHNKELPQWYIKAQAKECSAMGLPGVTQGPMMMDMGL